MYNSSYGCHVEVPSDSSDSGTPPPKEDLAWPGKKAILVRPNLYQLSKFLEHGHQVQLMPYIFSNAQQILFWVTEEDEFTTAGLSTLRSLARFLKYTRRRIPIPVYSRWASRIGIAASWRIRMEFASQGLGSPVYERSCVVQDICLARRITIPCGKSEISWQKMLTI